MKMIFTIGFSLLMGLAISSRVQAEIFDDPQNLEVLPDTISPEALRETMKDFAMGTGQRCSDCHKGEAGADLSTYDFASDEKELKQVARGMLKMVMAINDEYLESLGEDHTRVKCMTCHRGVKVPRMTQEVLTQAATKGGVNGLNKTYREMRERYYGTHSYDFSDMTLAGTARGLMQSGNPEEAGAMLDLILEDNPDSFNANYLYGELSETQGDRQAALAYYRKAVEINPRAAPMLQPKLDELSSPD
jgi:tetratricopeptide (TPR) repeat protein